MNKAELNRVKQGVEQLREILDREEVYCSSSDKIASKLGALTYWIEQLESEVLQ